MITLLLWRPQIYVAQKFSLHFCFQGRVTSLQSNGLRKGSTLAGAKSCEGGTGLMACGEVTGPDKDM